MRAQDGVMLPVLTRRQPMGTSDLEVNDRYLCARSRTRYFRRWTVGYPLTVACIWLWFKTATPVYVQHFNLLREVADTSPFRPRSKLLWHISAARHGWNCIQKESRSRPQHNTVTINSDAESPLRPHSPSESTVKSLPALISKLLVGFTWSAPGWGHGCLCVCVCGKATCHQWVRIPIFLRLFDWWASLKEWRKTDFL